MLGIYHQVTTWEAMRFYLGSRNTRDEEVHLISFPMRRSQRNINLPRKQKVLQVVRSYPGLTTSQVARYCKMSFPSTQRFLQEFEGNYLIHHRRKKSATTKISQIWFEGKNLESDLVVMNVAASLDDSKVVVKEAVAHNGKLFELLSN